MTFLQNLSDDQMAILGCFVAMLAACGSLYLTGYYGARRASHADQSADTLRLPHRTVERPTARERAA